MKIRTQVALLPFLAAALLACSPQDRRDVADSTRDTAKTVGSATERAAGNVASSATDATVTAKVKAQLLADDQIKGTRIDVDTSNGAVTLNGSVASPTQKQRAEQLAMNVEGVKRVQNNLSTTAK